MGENKLSPGMTRVGFVHGLVDKQEPAPAAVLQDDGAQILLMTPWCAPASPAGADSLGETFGFMASRVGGASWGLSNGELIAPQLVFYDVDGPVSLVGCRFSRTRENPAWSVGLGTLVVGAAIFGGNSLSYDRLNGLRTHVPNLAHWSGLTSVSEKRETDDAGKLTGITITLDSPEDILLHADLGLRIKPSWTVHRGHSEERRVNGHAYIETLVEDPLDWWEHIAGHQILRELMEIASWTPVVHDRFQVFRTDDPEPYLSGEPAEPRWYEARTRWVRQPSQPRVSPEYLWGFQAIGPQGFDRWRKLRAHFERGITPIMALVRLEVSNIETLLIQSSIGLEAIGYTLALDDGTPERDARNQRLETRLGRILADSPVTVVADGWPARATHAYNGVKHANRSLPDPQSVLNTARENILVFRAWASGRLGVRAEAIASALRYDRAAVSLRSQGLGF